MKRIGLVLVLCAVTVCSSTQVMVEQWHNTPDGSICVKKEYDKIHDYDKKNIFLERNGEIVTIPKEDLLEIKLPYNDINYAKMLNLEKNHVQLLKKRRRNMALGFSITGIVLMVAAHPISYNATKNMKLKTDEAIDDFSKRVTNSSHAIYWGMTGVGAIFEIVGIWQTVKLASGAKFGYGVKNNGSNFIV